MRVQRALARAGIASRRAAEELIREGKVRVDGKPATLGMKVNPSKQQHHGRRARGAHEGAPLARLPQAAWASSRPRRDEEGRRTVFDFIQDHAGLTYVGRLDVMTTGLLLLTTDGDAVHRLTHPQYHVPRRYTALVHGRPTAEVDGGAQQDHRDRRARGEGRAR